MSDAPQPVPDLKRARVWDLPIRLFHWALALCVIVGWYLGYYRSFTTIGWHFYIGYAVGGLLLFRVIWGFIGPRPARFAALFWHPADVWRYARGLASRKPSGAAGHSPIGSVSVLAMLVVLAVQVVTGLCAEDDALFSSGPLAGYLSPSTIVTMTAIHYYNSKLVLALVGLHVLAIAWYLFWKRENLVVAMISGWKCVRSDEDVA